MDLAMSLPALSAQPSPAPAWPSLILPYHNWRKWGLSQYKIVDAPSADILHDVEKVFLCENEKKGYWLHQRHSRFVGDKHRQAQCGVFLEGNLPLNSLQRSNTPPFWISIQQSSCCLPIGQLKQSHVGPLQRDHCFQTRNKSFSAAYWLGTGFLT